MLAADESNTISKGERYRTNTTTLPTPIPQNVNFTLKCNAVPKLLTKLSNSIILNYSPQRSNNEGTSFGLQHHPLSNQHLTQMITIILLL